MSRRDADQGGEALAVTPPVVATEDEIDRIGDLVGMAPGGWDAVDPVELIAAVLTVMVEQRGDGEEERHL